MKNLAAFTFAATLLAVPAFAASTTAQNKSEAEVTRQLNQEQGQVALNNSASISTASQDASVSADAAATPGAAAAANAPTEAKGENSNTTGISEQTNGGNQQPAH